MHQGKTESKGIDFLNSKIGIYFYALLAVTIYAAPSQV